MLSLALWAETGNLEARPVQKEKRQDCTITQWLAAQNVSGLVNHYHHQTSTFYSYSFGICIDYTI